MANQHPKVPATAANCEEDHQAKLKLNAEFEQFKTVVEEAAKTSRDVQKLIVPLERLEKVMIVAAHGKHLVATGNDKKQRS